MTVGADRRPAPTRAGVGGDPPGRGAQGHRAEGPRSGGVAPAAPRSRRRAAVVLAVAFAAYLVPAVLAVVGRLVDPPEHGDHLRVR